MSRRGRKTDGERTARGRVERPAFSLGMALALMPMLRLRVEQAERRYGCEELLGPALELMGRIEQEILRARACMEDENGG